MDNDRAAIRGDQPAPSHQGRPTERGATVLVRQFAILSLAVIGAITLALCLVISSQLRGDLLEREWGGTADFIKTEAAQALTPGDFSTPQSSQAQERFRLFYQQTVMMPEIVRVKVYDAHMRVIWSDEARLIGATFPDNPQLVDALAGHITVNLETRGRKEENVFERRARQLVEVYVPVTFPDNPGRVLGVIETYKDPAQVFANIRRGQLTVVLTALAGGVLLYLTLFWMVRRAGLRIAGQHRALEHQSREVTAANAELRAVQAQLMSAERMAAIGEVVTAVAHGIRNPLANIRASAQVALLDANQPAMPPTATRSLGNIVAEVDRLEGRVKDLLQFVRPAECGSRPVDLNAIVDSVLSQMSGRLAKAGVAVQASLSPALPGLTGDPMLLEQVFMNLVGNAMDATPKDGLIEVTTSAESSEGAGLAVVFEVRDRGDGIPETEIPRIFDLFYTTKAQGTGVGLAIAKKFTEAHGGAIAVQSRSGDGTVFRVTLPVRAERPPCP